MVKLITGKPEDGKVDVEIFRTWLEDSEHGIMGDAGSELLLVEDGEVPDDDNVIVWLNPRKKEIYVYSSDIEALGWEVEIV